MQELPVLVGLRLCCFRFLQVAQKMSFLAEMR